MYVSTSGLHTTLTAFTHARHPSSRDPARLPLEIECIHSEDSYTCLVLYVLRPVPARPAAAVLSAILGLLRTPSALPVGNLMIVRTPPQL